MEDLPISLISPPSPTTVRDDEPNDRRSDESNIVMAFRYTYSNLVLATIFAQQPCHSAITDIQRHLLPYIY